MSPDDAAQFFDELLTTLALCPMAERQEVVAWFIERVVSYLTRAHVALKFCLDPLTASFESMGLGAARGAVKNETDPDVRRPRQVYG